MKDIILQLLLQVCLIALNAFFACAEIAVITVNDTKLQHLSAQGNKKAARLVKLTNKPAKFLATIQVAITLSGFLGSAFAADNFAEKLTAWIVTWWKNVNPETVDTISVILITLVLSFFTLVFGELVPKRVAMTKAEKLALGMSGIVTFISKLFAPIVWLLTVSTNGMLRLFGIDPNAESEEVTEEEIRMMVDAGSEKGVIAEDEKEMIQNVFELDDLTAERFATHRTEICMLWTDESTEQWDTTIHENRHSFYPVCEETVDNIIGILNAKDYFRLGAEDKTKESIMEKAVKPAFYVPETIKADMLFKQMKKKRNYFAVVLDEYGGVSGIVTLKDIIEQLVGDIEDEDEPEEYEEVEDIIATDDGSWYISGSAALEEVALKLGVSLKNEDGDYDFETFGGFVFGVYGQIPDDGTTFTLDTAGLHIEVLDIAEHRIEKTKVSVLTGTQAASPDSTTAEGAGKGKDKENTPV